MSARDTLTEVDLETLARLRKKEAGPPAGEAGWMGWEEFASLPRRQAGKDSKERLARLRHAGYEFEEHPSYGLRLIQVPERLTQEEISFRLETEIIGRRIITLRQTTSTMDVARRLAEKSGEEGLVIFAEFQSVGRGRFGKRWVSQPAKDLLFSVILRPQGGSGHLLTITAAVAVARCIREALDLDGLIRWPNDVIIKEKKVAGMVVEGTSGDYGNFYILGVGINVNTKEEEIPEQIKATATTLRVEKTAPLDRTLLARKMLKFLDDWYLISREGKVEEISEAWRDLSSILGKRVRLLPASPAGGEEGKEFAGRVLDLSPREGIMLELDCGAQRLFRGEQVTLL